MAFRSARARAAALSLLSLAQCAASATPDAEYDYIVIGSGPGGGPLASALARADHTVLLLEAGSDQSANVNSEIPALFPLAYTDPSMTWDFFVRNYADEERVLRNNHLTWRNADGSYYVGREPPEGAQLLGLYYPRGGTLGGSSAINAMGPVLPSDGDWELIADLTGDASWSPENMRELFERIERNHFLPPGTPGHGFDGYFDTNAPDDSAWEGYDDLLAVFEIISESLGGATNVTSDANALSPTRDRDEGVYGGAQHVDENMRRFSSRDLVLETAESHPLTLKLDTLATKLIFDEEEEDRVVGVEYLEGQSVYRADPRSNGTQGGTPGKVYAKEVIVSAGVFNSPQILKLSGIGPREELEALGIEVRVDLPGVGANLQDNQEVPIVGHAAADFSAPAPDPEDPECTFGAPGDPCVEAWENGEGPYTQPGQSNSVFRVSESSEEGERDIFATGGSFAIRGFWPVTDSVPADPPNTFALSTVKIHPRSVKGSVLLRSDDPRDPPEINFNLFDGGVADADLDAYLDTVKWARRTFAEVPGPIGPIEVVEPPCDGTPDEEGGCDDEVDKEWVMDQFFGHHATSTCALGSVLDGEFRVKGVKGVRVVDASSFPRTPGAFPVLPVFMLSEKVAERILEGLEG